MSRVHAASRVREANEHVVWHPSVWDGLMATIGISGVEGFARAAKELYAAPNETELLQVAVDLAVRIIDGGDHAGISVVQGRELSTPIASDDVARRGDALQHQLDEGPCLDALRWQDTVISRDLREEARWPEWTLRAVSVLGVKAMMTLWLYAGVNPDGADSYGALNLYSDSIDPFGPNEYAIAQALAAQISVALAAQREIRGRGVAMTSRTIIGQAEGILMERLGLDADQAFAYLRRVSQSENRKLIMICHEIVRTRRLPQ
jgi:ANTAR domain/GAF domain